MYIYVSIPEHYMYIHLYIGICMYNINRHTYTQVVDVADAMVLATLFQVYTCIHVFCMYVCIRACVYVHMCMV